MFVEEKAYGENLKDFRDWVSKKNPNESYLWSDSRECACGQYARKLGVRDWHKGVGCWSWSRGVSGNTFWGKANALAHPPVEDNMADNMGLFCMGTFGALKERLDKELA